MTIADETQDPTTRGTPAEETRMDRPPFDPTALVIGLVISLVAVIGLLDPELARRIDLGVLVPSALVFAGAALLVTSVVARQRRATDLPGMPERDTSV